jgi:hypothetical protein
VILVRLVLPAAQDQLVEPVQLVKLDQLVIVVKQEILVKRVKRVKLDLLALLALLVELAQLVELVLLGLLDLLVKPV